MRGTFSKTMTAVMVAGAALLVSACGSSETNTVETNSMEMNSMEPAMEGSMNDVTAVDATMGADANMMGDNSMAMGNAMESNMMDNTSMGNAM
ncbi:hypothetical protein [Sphingomonas solaris]|uniref:Pentapeptide MXKDX repeat protein n=1 Tax=Alterirhizorhabdus solaris TaxID=2529389 RepID=A0A558R6N0_9SPHN|nr:hypothetical protein [Sphingomonas solaris]TVV75039.1 hypothetical protein FOY91_08130 [Sphingomonas solaris]